MSDSLQDIINKRHKSAGSANTEVNLKKIKELADKRKDENWEFRSFLKGYCRLSSSGIDRLVHEIYQEVSSIVECTQCGNCCKVVEPILKPADITRLAEAINIPPKQFREQYLSYCKEEEGFGFKIKSCPFLEDNHCRQYPQRPAVCRSYPHLHKKHFLSRLMGVIDNYALCPIVFNVYERLKQELGYNKKRKTYILAKGIKCEF